MSLTHTEELRMLRAIERIAESLKSIDKSLKSLRIPEVTVSLDDIFSDEIGAKKEGDA